MKKVIVYSVVLAICSGGLWAKSRSYKKDNIEITLNRAGDKIKGFKTFMVRAKNKNNAARSVEMKIYLNDRNAKEPAGSRGECTVFLDLKAGETIKQIKHCKEKKPSNSYSAAIIKVFNFSLKSKKNSAGRTQSGGLDKELKDMEAELKGIEGF